MILGRAGQYKMHKAVTAMETQDFQHKYRTTTEKLMTTRKGWKETDDKQHKIGWSEENKWRSMSRSG